MLRSPIQFLVMVGFVFFLGGGGGLFCFFVFFSYFFFLLSFLFFFFIFIEWAENFQSCFSGLKESVGESGHKHRHIHVFNHAPYLYICF